MIVLIEMGKALGEKVFPGFAGKLGAGEIFTEELTASAGTGGDDVVLRRY